MIQEQNPLIQKCFRCGAEWINAHTCTKKPENPKRFKFKVGEKVHLLKDKRVLTIISRQKWNPGEKYTVRWPEGDTSEFRDHELEPVD